VGCPLRGFHDVSSWSDGSQVVIEELTVETRYMKKPAALRHSELSWSSVGQPSISPRRRASLSNSSFKNRRMSSSTVQRSTSWSMETSVAPLSSGPRNPEVIWISGGGDEKFDSRNLRNETVPVREGWQTPVRHPCIRPSVDHDDVEMAVDWSGSTRNF